MKWFALLGLVLFLGVAVAPSINADVREQEIVEPLIVVEEQFEKLIGLVEGIITYYERTYGPLPDEDCGCQDIVEWHFPFICLLLYPPAYISAYICIIFGLIFGTYIPFILKVVNKLLDIGESLNCFWATPNTKVIIHP